MSYTRWNALRETVGVSMTMSRYSQNVPSQCCSRKRETSSFRSMIDTRLLLLLVVVVGIGPDLPSPGLNRSHAPARATHPFITVSHREAAGRPINESSRFPKRLRYTR